MKKKQVWVIERGEYSDYRVVGVFSTREKAVVVQDRVGGDIDQWELDPYIENINSGRRIFHVVMLKDGTTESVGESYREDLNERYFLWQRTKAPAYKDKGVPDALNASVWARNQKHAIKIANEIRTQMIARGEWK